MKKQEKYILFFLLFILMLMRLYHLNAPPVEIEESWRQADTESIAWNFATYDFNLFHPNLNYDGPLPNIPALEIQITTYLIAILYRIFGHHYFLARMVPIAFFLLSSLYLYLWGRRYLTVRGAALSLLIYGILPLNVYYSRAIMPESAALMFWIGGLYYFNCWVIGKKQKIPAEKSKHKPIKKVNNKLLLSALFLSLAIMTKPPVVFVAIPMLYLCVHSFKWKWLKFPELWGYALVTLALPACYYYLSARIAEFKFTVGITRNILLKNALSAFYSPEAYSFFSFGIPRTLGVISVLLIPAGIMFLNRKQTVVFLWFLAMLLEVVFIVSPIRASYYLVFFTVPCSLLIGNFLDRIFEEPTGKILSFLLILAIALASYYQVRPMFEINEVMAAQVQAVQKVTGRDDLLVVGSLEPCLLSLADRRGWRYNLRIYPDTPKDPYQELAYYIGKGAKYFVPVQGKIYGDEGDQIFKTLEGRYPKIEFVQGFPIFVLR